MKAPTTTSTTGKLFPWFAISAAALWLAFAARTPNDPADGFHLHKFSTIPVQEGGRLMPIETYARTNLMQLSHRQTTKKSVLKKEFARKKLEADDLKNDSLFDSAPATATEWLLDTLVISETRDPATFRYRVFRIDNDELLNYLDLKPSRESGYLFSFSDFAFNKKFKDIVSQIISKGGPSKDDILENKSAELAKKYETFGRIAEYKVPHAAPPFQGNKPGDDIANQDWLALSTMFAAIDEGQGNPTVRDLASLIEAYAAGNANAFNLALDRYVEDLNKIDPSLIKKNQLEVFFNNFAPYYQCTILFVIAGTLAFLSWIVWHKPLRQAAFAISILALVVYTWSLIVRVHLSGYAPVTNLYSSAVFIGWGCAGLCLIIEGLLKNGIGTALAAATASMALIVAHNLLDGDSMGKIQAVLESNFWLSTHVICITKGYTATFVAGFLGIAYVLLGRFTDKLRGEGGLMLGKVIYGVVCFAMLLSFIGTVLGGIWADQSWGRFWGWDPKENGALLIVIWNAVILHARWAGMVKTRGMANLAILGNIVTAWSWFGTNLLGVGLHAYGFMKGAMIWLLVWAAANVVIIVISLTAAQKDWPSFRLAAKPSEDA